MIIVWKMLMKSEAPGLSIFGRSGKEEVEMEMRKLTASNFADMSGKSEISENKLRTSQNRFLLHRSYIEGKDFECCCAGRLC